MPHKHKRQKTSDFSTFDLPPTTLAKALPPKLFTSSKSVANAQPSVKRTSKRSRQVDDTPRAFTRMLAFQQGNKIPSGLDNGHARKKAKTVKAFDSSVDPISAAPSSTAPLRRLPHETMSAFSQRVNAALPISGLAKSRPNGNKFPSIKGLKADGTKQTRMEKKMHKMQNEWREAKRSRDEALQGSDDEDEDLVGDTGLVDNLKPGADPIKRSRRSKKRGGRKGEDDDDDEDPWAELNARKRASVSTASSTGLGQGLVGLHDVVIAPPKLSAPRAVFANRTQDVPKAAGSLRRREELAQARSAVLDAMRSKGHRSHISTDSRNE